MSFKQTPMQYAFGLLFQTIDLGPYKYVRHVVKSRGDSAFSLTLYISESGQSQDATELAQHLGSIEASMKRTCFEFFAKNGVLVMPSVELFNPREVK